MVGIPLCYKMRQFVEVVVPYLYNSILLYCIIICKHIIIQIYDLLIGVSTCIGHLQDIVKRNELFGGLTCKYNKQPKTLLGFTIVVTWGVQWG